MANQNLVTYGFTNTTIVYWKKLFLKQTDGYMSFYYAKREQLRGILAI